MLISIKNRFNYFIFILLMFFLVISNNAILGSSLQSELIEQTEINKTSNSNFSRCSFDQQTESENFTVTGVSIKPRYPDENDNITLHADINNKSAIKELIFEYFVVLEESITQKSVLGNLTFYDSGNNLSRFRTSIGNLPWGTYIYIYINITDAFTAASYKFGLFSFHTRALEFKLSSIPIEGRFNEDINLTFSLKNALKKEETRTFRINITAPSLNFLLQEDVLVEYNTTLIFVTLPLDFNYEYSSSYKFFIRISELQTGENFYDHEFTINLIPNYVYLLSPLGVIMITAGIFLYKKRDLFGWTESRKYSPLQKIKGSLSSISKEGPLMLFPVIVLSIGTLIIALILNYYFLNYRENFNFMLIIILGFSIIILTYISWKTGHSLGDFWKVHSDTHRKKERIYIILLLLCLLFFLYTILNDFELFTHPDSINESVLSQSTVLVFFTLIFIPSFWELMKKISSFIVRKHLIGNSDSIEPYSFINRRKKAIYTIFNPITIIGYFSLLYSSFSIIFYYAFFPYSMILFLAVVPIYLGFISQYMLHKISYKTNIIIPKPDTYVEAGETVNIEISIYSRAKKSAIIRIYSAYLLRESYNVDLDANQGLYYSKNILASENWKTSIYDAGRFIIHVKEKGLIKKSYEQDLYINPAVNLVKIIEFFEKAVFNDIEALDQERLLITEYPDNFEDYGNIIVFGTTKSLNGADILGIFVKTNQDLKDKGEDPLSILFLVIKEELTESAHHQILMLRLDSDIPIIPLNSSTILEALENDSSYEALTKLFLAVFGEKDFFDYRGPIRDPEDFFGREKMLAEMSMDLQDGESLGIFGMRKIGKTSTIYQLMNRNSDIFWIDLNLEMYPSLKVNDIFFQFSKECLKKAEARGIKVPRELEILEIPDMPKFIEQFNKIKNFVIQKGKYDQVVIIIDEIDYILPYDKYNGMDGFEVILRAIRTIAQPPYSVPVIVVGLSASLNRDYNYPTFEFFKERWIKMVDRSSASKMVDKFGALMRMNFTEKGKEYLLNKVSSHPFVLRQVCSKISHLRREVSEAIEEDLINLGIEKFFEESTYFRELWEKSITRKDQKLLEKLLSYPEFNNLKDYKTEISHLLELGLIQKLENERLDFCMPIFKQWMKEEIL